MSIWDRNDYVIKQKVLAIGRKYYIQDGAGTNIGFCHQKAFKLKEDIRVYTDEKMADELLTVKQEQILDFSGTFAVTDPKANEKVGYVGRKALKSIIQDTWKIFDKDRTEIGTVEEEGGFMAIARRFIGLMRLFPKTYNFSANGGHIATVQQKFQIIGDTWTLKIDPACKIDKRLVVTAALMMDIVEQNRGA